MFEVGKKYIHGTLVGAQPFECVWANHESACMVGTETGHATIRDATDYSRYTEYKEPIKIVRYFNVYPEAVGGVLPSRKEADQLADLPNRIGCVRVEFTEGTYDD